MTSKKIYLRVAAYLFYLFGLGCLGNAWVTVLPTIQEPNRPLWAVAALLMTSIGLALEYYWRAEKRRFNFGNFSAWGTLQFALCCISVVLIGYSMVT